VLGDGFRVLGFELEIKIQNSEPKIQSLNWFRVYGFEFENQNPKLRTQNPGPFLS
jgi:hypothetical protein